MTVRRFVELLARRDRDCQTVLLRRQRTRGIRRHRAGRIVGAVEIEDDVSVNHRPGIEKASAGIGVVLRRQIVEHEEQARS